MRKRMAKRLVAGILVAVLGVTQMPVGNWGSAQEVVYAEETNLLTNGSFEDALGDEWVLQNKTNPGSTNVQGTQVTWGVYHGSNSCQIKNSDEWTEGYSGPEIWLTQTISNLPAGEYTFSFYAMGSGGSGAKAIVNNTIVSNPEIEFKGWTEDSSGWGTLTYTFEVESNQTDYVVGVCVPVIYANGDYYIDKISLIKAGEEGTFPEGDVDNGTFDTNINGWTTNPASGIFNYAASKNGNETGVCEFWTAAALDNAELSQKVKLSAGTYVVTADINGDAGKEFGIKLVVKNGSNVLIQKDCVTTKYDVWDKVETEVFTLDTDTVVTVGFLGNLSAGAWGGIDNVNILTYEEWSNAKLDKAWEDLVTKIAIYENYSSADYESESFQLFSNALTAAKDVQAKQKSGVSFSEVETAINNLENAVSNLVVAGIVEAGIAVEKISNMPEGFAKGVDVSSYISQRDSGVKYYDFEGNVLDDQGFFNLLAASGVNYVRIRVWNDPYDANGNGYGGGSNDVSKAIEIGKLASNAGMKVLVDFHFSDFWTDPGKQYVPKAWRGYTVEQKADAIKNFAKESLTTMKNNGVNIGMVQVGNESNAFFCGETDWANISTLFKAGIKGVKEVDSNILTVLHFADPSISRYTTYANNLKKYEVDYDVFATSYYEFYHGALSEMQNTMQTIATITGKYVMVAETSWATTLEDGDGHENQIKKGGNDTNTWEYSAGGQAAEVRDVMNAMVGIADKKGIGVFYWEPAWIPVQYAYDSNGKIDNSILASNKIKWEAYGSGWAASYGGEYQVDAKTWWGGSAMDNQAMFDMYGHPLESLKVFKYVTTGTSVKEKNVSSVTVEDAIAEVDKDIILAKANVRFNTGEKQENVEVAWNAEDLKSAKENGVGTYTIRGVIAGTSVGTSSDVNVKCCLTIMSKNILENGSVETSAGWTTEGALSIKKENAKTGEYSIAFWNNPSDSAQKIEGTASKTFTLDKGIYCIGGFAQGDGVDIIDDVTQEVTDAAQLKFELMVGTNAPIVKDVELKGYNNWVNSEVKLVEVKENGTPVTIKVSMANVADGGWGAWDDFYVYPVETVKFMAGDKLIHTKYVLYGQSVTVSASDLSGYTIESQNEAMKKVEQDTIIQVKLAGGMQGGGSSSSSVSTPSNTDSSATTKPDETKVESTTETKPDGTKVETKTETKPDGTKVETTTETATDGSKVETVKETEKNVAGNEVAKETVTKTDADGKVNSVVEKSVISEIAENTSATVTVKKDDAGKVTSATASVAATIEGKKTSISSEVVSQITEAAGQEEVKITVTAKDNSGKTLYKVKVDANDLEAGNDLVLFKVDSKTGELAMVNSKTYTVDGDGNLDISIQNKATYELMTQEEAKAVEKEIKATIKVKDSSKTVKKGKTAKIAFDKKMNMNNVKKITYSTADKSIAKVSKDGKITAKGNGTVKVKAKVTLKNGATKTVTMKVKVK